jgi:hypothetical protein
VRAKLIFAILAGILFCTVSTLEVPELLRLADDTSNDFPVVSVQKVTPFAAKAQVRTRSLAAPPETAAPRTALNGRFQSRGFASTVDDFLHSLCTLRT